MPKSWSLEPGPTLLERESAKCAKYGRLVLVAAKQRMEGKRSSLPAFTPFVVSDFGEMSPAAVGLQEWLVDQYRHRTAKLGPRSDGCATEQLVRQFRHKLKIGIQLAIAAGMGNMVQAAGQPWGDGLGPV